MSFDSIVREILNEGKKESEALLAKTFPDDTELQQQLLALDQTTSKGNVRDIINLYQSSNNNLDLLSTYIKKFDELKAKDKIKDLKLTAEELDGNLFYLSYPSMDDFDTQSGAKTILNWVDIHNIDFVIVDTISRFISGKENENDTWREVYKLTGQELKKRGTTFLRIDHSGKDLSKGARGGSAKEQDADITWSLSKPKTKPFVLSADSNRMPIEVDELKLVLNDKPLRFDWPNSREFENEEIKIAKWVKQLDETILPPNASVKETGEFIRNNLASSINTGLLSKVVKERKNRWFPEPSWSDEENLQPQHQLTEEDLFQSEHNAFHAKRRSAPKMEREWFGSFHEEDTTDWNDSESDHYPNEW